MKKHRFIQLPPGQSVSKSRSGFLFRIHAVIVKPGFTDGDDSRVGRDDTPDFGYIIVRRGIGHVGMNAGRTKDLMPDKVIDQPVFLPSEPVRIQQIPSASASEMIFPDWGKDRVNKLSPIS